MLTDILQPTHLLIVLVVALVVLGPKRLPDAGRSSARASVSSAPRSPARTRSRLPSSQSSPKPE